MSGTTTTMHYLRNKICAPYQPDGYGQLWLIPFKYTCNRTLACSAFAYSVLLWVIEIESIQE